MSPKKNVSPEMALEVLSTALQYCQSSGLVVQLEYAARDVLITLQDVTVVNTAGGTKLVCVPPARADVPPGGTNVPPVKGAQNA